MRILERFKELGFFWESIKTSISGSHEFSCPNKQPVIFFEIIPSKIAKNIGKDTCTSPIFTDSFYDETPFEGLNEIIEQIESVALSLLVHVKPQNLFFLFGEGVKFFDGSAPYLNIIHEISSNIEDFFSKKGETCYQQPTTRQDEGKPKMFAIVLCKGMSTDIMMKITRDKNYNTRKDKNYSYISWTDFKKTTNPIKHKSQDKS